MSTTDSHHKHAVRTSDRFSRRQRDRLCVSTQAPHPPPTHGNSGNPAGVPTTDFEVLFELGGHSAQVKPNTSFRKRTIAAAVAVSTASLSLVPAFSRSPRPEGSWQSLGGKGSATAKSFPSHGDQYRTSTTTPSRSFDGKKDVSQVVDAKPTP